MKVYEGSNSQAGQESFVLNSLKEKRGGFYVEIGGYHSKNDSNTYLLEIAFDLPSMISLVPEDNKLSSITYTTDWNYVKGLKFDTVLASLVFQHIEDAELNEYLNDISKMTDKIVIHSRTWIDHSETKVLPILEKYFIMDSIEHTADPNNPIDDHFIAVMRTK